MAAEQTFGIVPSTIQVFEARFGNKDGQHALLEFPPQKRDFFLSLFNKADLPDSAPAGATWDPFVRGWTENDCYMVALTEADHTAVRPGMIATRMIAAALTDAEKCDNLGALFEILQDPARAYTPEFTIPLSLEKRPSTVAPSLLACAAHHLINEEKPAALIGQKGFENLVSAIWQKLPHELRRTFTFGFSFTPTDLTVTRANIVAVPSSCETRWSGYKFKCDANWNQPVSDSLAAFLSNEQAFGFLKFLQSVGLAFHSFSDYGRYTRLWNYWQKRGENAPEITHALLRSLGTLLPSPNQAWAQKEEAMIIATALLKTGSEEDILALRSVKASAFPFSAAALERAVYDWIKTRIQSSQADNGVGLAKVVMAVPSSQSAEWQTWIRKGLKIEFEALNDNAAQTIWLVWKVDGALAEIGAHLPSDATTEMVIIRACPTSLPTTLFSTLQKWSVDRGWICLMAKAALTYLGFAKAVDLVCSQNRGTPTTAAIELLCATATPSEVWLSAFINYHPALIKCAVAAAKIEPALWGNAINEIDRWVAILEAAANADPDFLRAGYTSAITKRLFSAWERGISITEAICEALEKAGRLEFNLYSNRSELWTKLPKRYLVASLSNTLRAWLQDYYSKPPIKPKLEKELVEILFAAEHRDFTFPCNSPFLHLGGFILVEAWGNERDCENWLYAVVSSDSRLSEDFARKVGEFVLSKRWMTVARHAKNYDHDWKRYDVWPIWRACYDPLGIVEKLTFDLLPLFSVKRPKLQHSFRSTTMTDAVFFTALPEEFSAVIAHLSDAHEHVEKGTVYRIGRFSSVGIDYTVAVVLTGMGNALSAAATERALALFKPTFAFFVGIAGGLRNDLAIGDVIAADKVYGYEGGKAAGTFKTRPEATTVSHEALQRANAVVINNVWQNRISPTPDRRPHAFIKPIAAGEKIIASKQSVEFKRLRETYSDAHAVAMEEHGFCVSVKIHPSVCFAVVRGISDLIVKKEEADRAGSHDAAARNAAAFAFEMLTGLLSAR